VRDRTRASVLYKRDYLDLHPQPDDLLPPHPSAPLPQVGHLNTPLKPLVTQLSAMGISVKNEKFAGDTHGDEVLLPPVLKGDTHSEVRGLGAEVVPERYAAFHEGSLGEDAHASKVENKTKNTNTGSAMEIENCKSAMGRAIAESTGGRKVAKFTMGMWVITKSTI